MDTKAEKSLATKKDIDKKLSERLGIPLEIIQENTTYIVKRLIQMQDSEDIFKIQLSPDLGYMYCNQNMLSHNVKRHSRYQDNNRYRRLVNKMKVMSSLIFTQAYLRIKVLKTPRINRMYFRMGMTHSELEKFQNKIYNEQQNK